MEKLKKISKVIFSWATCFLLIGIFLSVSSCASKNSFQSFYNQNKSEADWALAFPKYVAMIAIPKDSKEEIKRFSQGMRKIRVLLNENKEVDDDDRLLKSFSSFAEGRNYTSYLAFKKDGSEINLFAREEENFIREIVLDLQDEEGSAIICLIGKMEKKNFQKALKRVADQ